MFQIIWSLNSFRKSPSITNFLTTRDSTYNSSHVDAWLNIVVLDEQLNPVMTNDGNNSYYEQVGNPSTANVKQYNISRPITKSGYVYVYVSDESPNVAAYWDDLQVTHVKGHLLQENSYYPFGLEMKALSSQAALKPQTTYKYNAGTNLESDFDVDYYETPARNYDPQVGRFTEIDAMSEQTMSMTTYQFAGNNPIIANDPSGMLKQYQQKPDLSSINLNADPRDINIDMINQMDNFNEGADDMMWAGWEQSGAGGGTENLTDVSQYGGTFQNNGDGTFSFTPFQTEDDAFNWGVNYMTQNNLWGTNGWASSVTDADKKFTTAMGWGNGPWVGVEGFQDVYAQVVNLSKNKDYMGALNVLNNAFPTEFRAMSSTNFIFEPYAAELQTIPTEDKTRMDVILGENLFQDLVDDKINFGVFTRTIYHEMLHVENYLGLFGQKLLNNTYGDHNEREFLAYYGMIFNNDLPPMTTQQNYSYARDAILNYYNKLSPTLQQGYVGYYNQLSSIYYPQ